jgi:hypothetical protein
MLGEDRSTFFILHSTFYIPFWAIHHLHCIPYMSQPALAQQIELVQAEILAFQHADLRNGKALRRTVQRGVVRHRFVRDHDAARVDAEMVRHADEQFAVPDHRLRHLVQIGAGGVRAGATACVVTMAAFAQRIDLFRR